MSRSHAASLPDGYTGLPPGKIAAVVTYLEMRQPPAAIRRDDPPGLRLRKIDRPDVAWYRRLFRAIGEDWLWFCRLQLDDRQLAAILHDPAVDVFTLEHECDDKGLLEIDRRDTAAIELAYLGVTKDLIGRRAGRFLVTVQVVEGATPRKVVDTSQNIWQSKCLEAFDSPASSFEPQTASSAGP